MVLRNDKDWVITDYRNDNAVELIGGEGITEEGYYENKSYITNSMLSMLNKSPLTLQAYLDGERQESDAFALGEAVHLGILEPEKFIDIVVWDERMFPQPTKTIRTKENRVWLSTFKKVHKGKLIIKRNHYNLACDMIDSAKNKPAVLEELKESHKELVALKSINGINCKSKGDIVPFNGEWMKDLKTTKDASLEGFKKSCEDYGYYRQAAMYCHMFGKSKFKFIVIEKQPPFHIGIYEVSQEKLEQGWQEIEKLIEAYKFYFQSDNPFDNEIDKYVMTGIL